MKKSLKNILIISYSIMALLIVLGLSLFFNIMADSLFEQYAIKQQRTQIDQMISQIDQLYDEKTGTFDQKGIEIIGYAALQNGLIIHVQAENSEMDWDMRTHRSHECDMILKHAEGKMKERYPNFNGSYTQETYTLDRGGTPFGTLKVGYYGPYSLNDQELELMGNLNHSLLVIGAIALLGVVILGTLIACAVSKPIDSVILVAQKIAGGEYGAQARTGRGMRETSHMVEAINEMSLALEKEEKQKRQITSDVAHELRTPLTNLQSHMEAMIDGIWDPTSERLKSCHAEILRLVRIVEQLQELYSLENCRQELNRTEFEFCSLCREVFHDFEIRIRAKEIVMEIDAQQGDRLYADYFRIKQCLVNLLSNALTYTPEGGTIRVTYRTQEDGKIVISVEDNGIGVPKEELPFLFDRFYRVDKSRSKKTGGMGIGLSITKAIVEQHGGRIHGENREGGGTRFFIKLPGKNK